MANEQQPAIAKVVERKTELRHISNYELRQIASHMESNDEWVRLVELIPKSERTPGERKFSKNQIEQIKTAVRDRGLLDALCGHIFLDEWSTMGKKDQRPTIGILLDLLVKAELFRAADYVSEKILKEPRPPRPTSGPAAAVDIYRLPTDLIRPVESYANDEAYQPNTSDLFYTLENASVPIHNYNFYEKNENLDNKRILLEQTNTTNGGQITDGAIQLNQENPTQEVIRNEIHQQRVDNRFRDNSDTPSTPPKISTQSNQEISSYGNDSGNADSNYPSHNTHHSSFSNSNGETLETHLHSNQSDSDRPNISLFQKSSASISTDEPVELQSNQADVQEEDPEYLPQITELNLNSENISQVEADVSPQSVSESNALCNGSCDDIEQNMNNDEDDDALPNLSQFDNGSSSLTTVTGTSAENSESFDLSSSTSNENLSSSNA